MTGRPQVPDNPYLSALPALATMRERADELRVAPHYSAQERSLRPVERRFALMRLSRIFIPAPRHIRFAEGLDMLLHSGYEGRDPSGMGFAARAGKIARRRQAGTLLAPRPASGSGGAGNGFLIGAPGMGKTRTIEHSLRRYPQVCDHPGLPRQICWMKLECPSRGSIRSLCIQFFDELSRLVGNTDYRALYGHRKASEDTMMSDMALAASFHGLGILVIDEIQHIGRISGEEHGLMTFLTQLTNQLAIPVVFIGTLSVLPQVQRTARMARRSVGPACALWEPRRDDPDWRRLLEEVWRYQWTEEVNPLTEELAATIYDCTGGIIDLMVKLYLAVQLRLIYRSEIRGSTGGEIITPEFVRRVADADFAPIKPMVEALCLGDRTKLARFDDLHSFDRGFRESLSQLFDQPLRAQITAPPIDLPLIPAPEGDAYQMIWAKLSNDGLGEEIILQLIDTVRAEGLDAEQDLLGFFARISELRKKRKGRKAPAEKVDTAAMEACDLRRLVAEAAESGLTPLEAIRAAGLTGIWLEAA